MLLLLLVCLNLLQFALLYLQYKERQKWQRELARSNNVWIQNLKESTDRVMHLAGKTWTPPPLTEEEKERLKREQEERDEANKRALEGWSEL